MLLILSWILVKMYLNRKSPSYDVTCGLWCIVSACVGQFVIGQLTVNISREFGFISGKFAQLRIYTYILALVYKLYILWTCTYIARLQCITYWVNCCTIAHRQTFLLNCCDMTINVRSLVIAGNLKFRVNFCHCFSLRVSLKMFPTTVAR